MAWLTELADRLLCPQPLKRTRSFGSKAKSHKAKAKEKVDNNLLSLRTHHTVSTLPPARLILETSPLSDSFLQGTLLGLAIRHSTAFTAAAADAPAHLHTAGTAPTS